MVDRGIIGRCRGALLGLAVGDAVGATVEFRPSGTFEPVTGMAGGGPFHRAPGQWTDDTSLALCLAESLLACRGFDPADRLRSQPRRRRRHHGRHLRQLAGAFYGEGGIPGEWQERLAMRELIGCLAERRLCALAFGSARTE